jgi:phospholipid/cholesterol/gamma-HCH transport system substrate-binding protein
VGIFVLVGFFSFVAALFLLTDPSTFRGRYFLTTTVSDAGGLRRGDPVQMRGVNIGRTHDFELLGDQVRVTLEVEGEWRVPTDSRSRLVELGVLGGKIVEILPGNSPEYLEPGANLPGVEYSGLLGTAEVLGERADVIMGRVEEMLSEPTIEAVQASAQDLRELLKELSALAQDQSSQVAQLTASLNRTAQSLEETSAAGPDLASAATSAATRADSTLAQLNRTSVRLDGVATSLGSILERPPRASGALREGLRVLSWRNKRPRGTARLLPGSRAVAFLSRFRPAWSGPSPCSYQPGAMLKPQCQPFCGRCHGYA